MEDLVKAGPVTLLHAAHDTEHNKPESWLSTSRLTRRAHENATVVALTPKEAGSENHLSENSVSRTFPLSPITHTSVCGLVVFVRST